MRAYFIDGCVFGKPRYIIRRRGHGDLVRAEFFRDGRREDASWNLVAGSAGIWFEEQSGIMKIRFSHVSNSSSSSFIVIGSEVDGIDAALELSRQEGKVVIAEFDGRGTSGDCGDFICQVTDQTAGWLRNQWCSEEAKFIDVGRCFDEYDDVVIGEGDKDRRIWFFDLDDSAPGLGVSDKELKMIKEWAE